MDEELSRLSSFLPTFLMVISGALFFSFGMLADQEGTKKEKEIYNDISSIGGFLFCAFVVAFLLQKLGEEAIATGLAIGAVISFQLMKRYRCRDLGFSKEESKSHASV